MNHTNIVSKLGSLEGFDTKVDFFVALLTRSGFVCLKRGFQGVCLFEKTNINSRTKLSLIVEEVMELSAATSILT